MRREEFPIRTLLVLVGVAGLLWGMDMAGWLKGAKGVSEAALSPMRAVFMRAGQLAYGSIGGVRRVYRSQARVADLERQVNDLQIQVAQTEALQQDNASLRQALGLQSQAYVLVSAKVVGLGDGLLVVLFSGGSVKPGMAVVTQEGGLVGKVERVDEFTAKVEPITDADFKLGAVTGGGTKGMISGTGSGVELRQVLQAEGLTAGDRVVTLGEDQVPGGIVAGTIGQIYQMPSEVYKTSVIKPLANLKLLDRVMIILGRQS